MVPVHTHTHTFTLHFPFRSVGEKKKQPVFLLFLFFCAETAVLASVCKYVHKNTHIYICICFQQKWRPFGLISGFLNSGVSVQFAVRTLLLSSSHRLISIWKCCWFSVPPSLLLLHLCLRLTPMHNICRFASRCPG